MMYWYGDWNWAAWLTMTLTMVVFWGAVIWLAIALFRQVPGERGHRPEDTLADRFARGEIDEDEYQRRRDTLRTVR
ncbi:MAG: SHOCT domain-containing protein [Actinobacteria bacterium]|nr:SHOCT domain-containing protein [Actinomycetota bacterium]